VKSEREGREATDVKGEVSNDKCETTGMKGKKSKMKERYSDLLTPKQLTRLKESIKQADEGKVIPHEEVIKISREWLKKDAD